MHGKKNSMVWNMFIDIIIEYINIQCYIYMYTKHINIYK